MAEPALADQAATLLMGWGPLGGLDDGFRRLAASFRHRGAWAVVYHYDLPLSAGKPRQRFWYASLDTGELGQGIPLGIPLDVAVALVRGYIDEVLDA